MSRVAAAGAISRKSIAVSLPVLAVVQDHEAAAADVARVGQRHRQREADGHGRVDRVAALAQHVHADVGGERALAELTMPCSACTGWKMASSRS